MERPIANPYDWRDYSSWGRTALKRAAMCSTAIIVRTDTTGKRDSRAVGRFLCRRLRGRRRQQRRPVGIHTAEEAHPDTDSVRSSVADADTDPDAASVAVAEQHADAASDCDPDTAPNPDCDAAADTDTAAHADPWADLDDPRAHVARPGDR